MTPDNGQEEARENSASLPLDGVRVLEMAEGVAGPFCARLLADMGAQVVKVEPPGRGDVARRRGPFPGDDPHPEGSGLFLYLNVNKRGVTLDIQCPTGMRLFQELVARADLLVEATPPGLLDGLGVGAAQLRKRHPALIVVSITPFGQTGPRRHFKTTDLVTFNVGGIANGTPGFPDFAEDREKEPPLKPDTPVAGLVVGSIAAAATVSALLARDLTGQGCHLDISEQDAVAGMASRDAAGPSYAGILIDRASRLILNVPNIYMPCKDGHVAIVGYSPEHWPRLCAIMGDPEWTRDEKYATPDTRRENWDELKVHLLEWTMSHTQKEILEGCIKSRLPGLAPFTVAEMAESEHVKARGSLVEVEVRERRLRMPGPPVRWVPTAQYLRRPAPRLGEHNVEVLGEMGYSKEDVARLRDLGVI